MCKIKPISYPHEHIFSPCSSSSSTYILLSRFSGFCVAHKNTISVLQMFLSIPITPQSLSSAKTLSSDSISSVFLTTRLSNLSLTNTTSIPFKTGPIRMGGGARTFPGGVSKWQWKRMQAKKAKQLLIARLTRERQIYEMRKRAELKAAVSEFERPWEPVEKPPHLFSASADEQLKVLADRFQKPGGLDLWSDRDGPELFRPDDGLSSSRFFPKGVVHSVKPNAKLTTTSEVLEGLGPHKESGSGPINGIVAKTGLTRKDGGYKNSRYSLSSSDTGGNVSVAKESEKGNYSGKLRKKGNRKGYSSDSGRTRSRDTGYYNKIHGTNHRQGDTSEELWSSKNSHDKGKNENTKVFDMSLQNDGTYGFELERM